VGVLCRSVVKVELRVKEDGEFARQE
jgi:hypothetical protein